MRQFRTSAGTECRLEFGDELAAGLRCDEDTVHLAPPVERANAALESVWLERLQAQHELARTRARVRVRDGKLVRAIRAVHNTVGAVTRMRSSELERELFPEGLTAAVTPAGARFERVARDLLAELERTALEGSQAVRAQSLAMFRTELSLFSQALDAREQAEEALKKVRRREVKAREEHARAIVVVDGALRVRFPRDPARRRMFEPRSPRAGGRADERETEPPSPPAVAEPTDGSPPGHPVPDVAS